MFLDFQIIKKKKILIYDSESIEWFKKILKKKDYNIYYNRWFTKNRKEKINFWILLNTLIHFKYNNLQSFKEQYKKNYINCASPKVIITLIDTNPAFYLLKKEFPEIKTIAVQNGVRVSNDFDIFKKQKKIFKDLRCDYFFVFSKIIANRLSKYIKSNYIISGSFKMNHVGIKKYKRKNKILYISQTPFKSNLGIEKYEKLIIKLLYKICKKKKLKMDICCKKNMKKKLLAEFRFLKSDSVIESKGQKSYEIIQKYKLNIFKNSTLGFESLAIGEKTFSVPAGCFDKNWKKNKHLRQPEKFGYPLDLSNSGYCWENELIENKIEKKIFNIIKLKKKQWEKINLKYNKFISYNKNNSILKKILHNHIF